VTSFNDPIIIIIVFCLSLYRPYGSDLETISQDHFNQIVAHFSNFSTLLEEEMFKKSLTMILMRVKTFSL